MLVVFSENSSAKLPVLAVRKVLDTVLSLRVHGVRRPLCDAAAAGIYMTYIFKWYPTEAESYFEYTLMMLPVYGRPAVPQLLPWRATQQRMTPERPR